MFLAIDVGNTQATLGLLDKGEVIQHWRLKTVRDDTSDELHARLLDLLALRGLSIADVDAAAICSVVPTLTEMWTIALSDAMGTEPFVVRPSDKCCINIDMPYPTQVGADRIANAVEAKKKYGSPVIVVDFGTATNIDVVDSKGNYRGGCIAPGLMLSASALFAHAAKLASIPIQVPPAPIGDTTEHALQSGLVLGVASQAEGLVARIKNQLAEEASSDDERTAIYECPVVATGGLSRIINEATDVFSDIDGDLTLRGIYRIWQSHQ